MKVPVDLTRPERYAERLQAKQVKARMEADRRRHGNCVICAHRCTTFGVVHCRRQEERQKGACSWDCGQPTFVFDATTLEKYRDAA